MVMKENKTGLLYATLIGLVASDIIPTPGDALYFWLHKKIRDKWTRGEYTAKQYWIRESFYYYFLNSTWWALVGTAIYFTHGNYKNKLKTGIILAGAGVMISVLFKIIQKDENDKLAELQREKQLLFEQNNLKNG